MPDDSKANEVNHVYILGAGFSRPMGGPLFTDLFTKLVPYGFLTYTETTSPNILAEIVDVDSTAYLAKIVRHFPMYFQDFKEHANNNPEHFLELCDCALNGKEVWFTTCLIKRFFPWTVEGFTSLSEERRNSLIERIINCCKIRLALETNTFTQNVPNNNDRWSPYTRWFEKLGRRDTLISLNYDLLVETVAEKKQRPFPGRNFKIMDDSARVEDLLEQNEREPNLPLLCKLHGSVDWFEKDEVAFVKRYAVDDYFYGYPPLLGTPGTGKVGLSEGSLKRVWQTALERLRDAHVISIVGYSLPETDNDFRIKLLDSIRENNGNLKAINIVLGQPTPHSQRARAILEQATRLYSPVGERPTVNLLPIYAQDYLPYYRPSKKTEIHDHAFPRC